MANASWKAGISLAVVVAIAYPITSKYEGKSNPAYPDPGYGWKIPTICYGHTKGVHRGDVATDAQCEKWLKEDLAVAAKEVLACLSFSATERQIAGFADFQFNTGQFCTSTMKKKFNEGDCLGATREFNRWVYSNKKFLKGLAKRREAEQGLVESDCKGG